MLLIPGKKDAEGEMRAQCQCIARDLGVDVPLDFHRLSSRPQDDRPTARRRQAVSRAHAKSPAQRGCGYVYTGNVRDVKGGTTFCHACRAPLIVRHWHEMPEYRVVGDRRCADCGSIVAGHFGTFAPAFGRRRVPIAIRAV